MFIDIITIFPQVIKPYFGESILKIAQHKGKLQVRVHDLRDYTPDKHKKIDDRPFGGGAGMVFTPEPIFRAVEAIKSKMPKPGVKAEVILFGLHGEKLTQKLAKKLSLKKHIILICGHYEGVDERVGNFLADKEISIGDYVLTGGELAAMVLSDAVVRLLPGVLGHKDSNRFESFSNNLLEYPQYTRPENFKGMAVPKVLLTGNHEKIREWRETEALRLTRKRRPDLLKD